jgi:hypothetical protein
MTTTKRRRATKRPITGYKLWEGKSWYDGSDIVAVATLESDNEKTGNMIQVWILSARHHPVVAARRGFDAATCGDCVFRSFIQRRARSDRASDAMRALMRSKSCYVELGKAPAGVYRAYKRGRYPQWDGDLSLFRGRSVRFGAYGDPAFLPVSLVARIARAASGHTGYTHQWRDPRASWTRKFLMASCDAPGDVVDAVNAGWRYFYAKSKSDAMPAGSIVCPASSEAGARTKCIDCNLCDGVQYDDDRRKSITINTH